METSVSVYFDGRRFLADIRLDGINIANLHSVDNDWLKNLVRPQVAVYFRVNEGVSNPEKIDEYVRAIVDGDSLPKRRVPEEKSENPDSLDPDTPPHTKGDS